VGDGDASRAELLKAYKHADAYRKENERLKAQMDQVTLVLPCLCCLVAGVGGWVGGRVGGWVCACVCACVVCVCVYVCV